MEFKKAIIYTDGGCWPNPGPATIGYIIRDERGRYLKRAGCSIGLATCNIAEYTAVIKALQAAKKLNGPVVEIYSDSSLIVNQINGRWKVHNEKLADLLSETLALLCQFQSWSIRWISRERNTEADGLTQSRLAIGE